MKKRLYENLYLIIGLVLIVLMFIPLIKILGTITNPYNDELLTKNIALKDKNDYLLKELKNTLKHDYSDYYNYEINISKLIITNPYNIYDSGIILLGKNDVSKNDLVLYKSHLVGIVDRTYKNISYVKLITSGDNIPVVINGEIGVLCGYNPSSNLYKICNITNYSNINVNDKAIYFNDKNILIGTVAKVDNYPIEKTIYVENSININSINYVAIIKDSYVSISTD